MLNSTAGNLTNLLNSTISSGHSIDSLKWKATQNSTPQQFRPKIFAYFWSKYADCILLQIISMFQILQSLEINVEFRNVMGNHL